MHCNTTTVSLCPSCKCDENLQTGAEFSSVPPHRRSCRSWGTSSVLAAAPRREMRGGGGRRKWFHQVLINPFLCKEAYWQQHRHADNKLQTAADLNSQRLWRGRWITAVQTSYWFLLLLIFFAPSSCLQFCCWFNGSRAGARSQPLAANNEDKQSRSSWGGVRRGRVQSGGWGQRIFGGNKSVCIDN